MSEVVSFSPPAGGPVLVAPDICLTGETQHTDLTPIGVDWLTLEVEVPDSYQHVDDGLIERVSREGEVKWQVRPGVQVAGSFEAGVQVRTQSRINEPGRVLKISGNPTKFLFGHNVTPAPSNNIKGLSDLFIRAVCNAAGVPAAIGPIRLTRIDITAMCQLGSREECVSVLHSLADQSRTAYRGRATKVQNTCYFGSLSSKYWSGKAYLKSVEIESRKKGHKLDYMLGQTLIERLKAWADTAIRIEYQINTRELERRGLSAPENFSPDTCTELYNMLSDKVHINQPVHLNHDAVNELKPHLQRAYLAWFSGHELALPRATRYRVRAQIRELTGVDIDIPRTQREQLVRLQKVIQLKPCAPPAWAFEHVRLAA